MSSTALRLDLIRTEPGPGSGEGSAFAALASLLQSQVSAARALHKALRRKQEVLVKNRLSELAESAEHAISLAIDLARLEEQRISELERLAAEGHLPSEPAGTELKAEKLLTYVPDGERGTLAQRCHELAEEIAMLSETNLQNDLLMENLADYTGTVLRLLTRQDSPPTYGRRGSVLDGPGSRSLLDSRV